MRIVSAKLFNKLGNTELTQTVNGRLEQPRIVAKNWYQINTNKRLMYNLIIHGNVDTFGEFDAVTIKGKSYIILNKQESGTNSIKLEIGSGGNR